MRRLVIALLAGLALLPLAACRRKAEPPKSALGATMRSLHATPPCDAAIPMEWPASWPVPTGDEDGRQFRVFFYPLLRGPGGQPQVFAPLGEALFNGESGAITSCVRGPGPPAFVAARRWPESTDLLSIAEFETMAARLMASTEEVSRLFAARRPLSDGETRRVREFRDLFDALAEPVFLGAYRELNPDFWYWVTRVAGPPPQR
ncbi:MAG: hypothetical protein HY924_15115 [Elusimicrobia bacterium]|nr:hypothetical protein [Elusimicrobiota bacterium]